MDAKELIEARKKAEAAVAEMPEGELRLEAFKIILNRLLSGGEGSSPERSERAKGHRERAAKRKAANEENADVIPRSAPARILALKAEGFFDEQRGIGEIREELQTHGWRYEVTALSGALMSLVQKRELRRSKVEDGSKTTYKYFNP
jgi:hypothetical protein